MKHSVIVEATSAVSKDSSWFSSRVSSQSPEDNSRDAFLGGGCGLRLGLERACQRGLALLS
jgi:hypothetical protein